MIGLTDPEVMALIKALAKAHLELTEWQKRHYDAAITGIWLVAEAQFHLDQALATSNGHHSNVVPTDVR